MLAAWLRTQLHSPSCKHVSCENMAVFQIALPWKWPAVFAPENLPESSVVVVRCFSVAPPFLFGAWQFLSVFCDCGCRGAATAVCALVPVAWRRG